MYSQTLVRQKQKANQLPTVLDQQLSHLHCISNSVNSSAEMWILFIVHRAPVLVALALIESGMKYEDAVEFIRRYVKSEY